MEFRDYLGKVKRRFTEIDELFGTKELKISLDRIKTEKKVDYEVLYFDYKDKKDATGLFLFGFDFFLKESNEQEFKRIVGHNALNYRIYKAYYDLSKKQKKVKVSDIINYMHKSEKDSILVHNTLKRIFTLAYYLNWKLEKDKKDIEGDYVLEMPNRFLVKLKQRFNFDVICPVYENNEFFIFLNTRGKLNLVFKDKNTFTKADIEKIVVPVLKKLFSIKEIKIEN